MLPVYSRDCHRCSGKMDVIACLSCTTVLVFEEVRRPATASAIGLLAAGTENYEPLAQVHAQEQPAMADQVKMVAHAAADACVEGCEAV
jgi:hypothetical protein